MTNDCTSPLRIGAVAYLNAKPLVCGLSRLAPRAEVIVDLPSRLADELAAGRLDVALIPSVEYFSHPGYRIVSDACVACDGPVMSVKLFGRVPAPRISTLDLDEGSRTSAALARILLAERLGRKPRSRPLPIGDSLGDSTADAVLLIGDRAIREPAGRFAFVWDLGEEWSRWTGLPFVFAMWVARPEVELGNLAEALNAARDEGVRRLDEIAARESLNLAIPAATCRRYLRNHLRFELGPRQRQGLERFRVLAAAHQLAPVGYAPA